MSNSGSRPDDVSIATLIGPCIMIGLVLIAVLAGAYWGLPSLYAQLVQDPKGMQVSLEGQNYDITMNDVRDLIGNKHDFLTEGGKGPESTITFEKEEIEVYLSIEKTNSTAIPILRYVKDDSVVGSPAQLPRNLKETW